MLRKRVYHGLKTIYSCAKTSTPQQSRAMFPHNNLIYGRDTDRIFGQRTTKASTQPCT